ncbi:ABC transporter permease [Orbus sasakiae]|uniref:ABC transporter permease n=1 Tax=Orbus sasakiae TaxID=1078475 RepID=A0ABP9N3Q1_9GAMM
MLSAIIKEFRLLSRDLHGMVVLFLMPMIFMLIMSIALSQADDVNQNIKLALVGSELNQLNHDVINELMIQQHIHADFFDLTALDKAKQQLINKKYDVLIINVNYQSTSLKDEQPVELLSLASMEQTRLMSLQAIVKNIYLQKRIGTFSTFSSPNEDISGPTPSSQMLTQFLATKIVIDRFINDEGETVIKPSSVQQSVPAWLIFGMFFIMIPLSNVMTGERQTNTITRLRLAKSSAFSLLFAKLIPYFMINQFQFIGMIALGIYFLPIFGIEGFHLYGAFWHYGLLSIAISLSALGYALLVSVLAKTPEHAVVLGGGGNIIMAALGGIMVPSYMMPETMQTISLISPMSWSLKAFHNLLLNQYDFSRILPEWCLLIVFATVFLTLASIIYCRQLKK